MKMLWCSIALLPSIFAVADEKIIPAPANSPTAQQSIQQLVENAPQLEASEEEIRAIQTNKTVAYQVWANSLHTKRQINANNIHEYLERTNKRLPIPSSLLIGKPDLRYLINVPMSPMQAFSEDNGRHLYSGEGYSFYNEYSKEYLGKPDLIELSIMGAQSKACKGFLSLSATPESKKDIEDCFLSKDIRMEILAGRNVDYKNYLSAIKLVTSITRNNGQHICMASFYQKNKWITAKHCLVRTNIELGANLLLPNRSLRIKRTDIDYCNETGCDVAIINLPTSDILGNSILNTSPDLKSINPKTEIFIPGIVQRTPLAKGIDRKTYESMLLWSDVGKGYCRIRNIYEGCISHTCSTIDGFSGAPVYNYEKNKGEITLLGIHSGFSAEPVSCKGKGDKSATNYAVLKPLYEGM